MTPLANTFPHQHESRIGDGWRTSIGNKGDIFASLDAGRDLLHRLMFIELVVGLHLVLYLEMFQQDAGRTGILR